VVPGFTSRQLIEGVLGEDRVEIVEVCLLEEIKAQNSSQ